MRVSQELKLKVLQAVCGGTRQYKIANAAGLHPTVMSALLNDIRPVRPDDARVIAIGKVVGCPPERCLIDDKSRG